MPTSERSGVHKMHTLTRQKRHTAQEHMSRVSQGNDRKLALVASPSSNTFHTFEAVRQRLDVLENKRTKTNQTPYIAEFLLYRVFLIYTLHYQVILLIAEVELIDKSHLRAIKK